MYLDKPNKFEIRRRALLEAINFCGGVAAYSNRIKVSRSRASNWLNRTEINIPYEYVVLTEDVTGVHIERLSPFTETANKALRRLRSSYKPPLMPMNLHEVMIDNNQKYLPTGEERPVIVGTDRVLISGLTQIEAYKTIRMKKIMVVALDLEFHLLEMKQINALHYGFLVSEQIAIGLRLERLISNRKNNEINIWDCKCETSTTIEHCRICDEVATHYGQVAEIIGLPNAKYYSFLRYIYLYGDSRLIFMMDKKEISISQTIEAYKTKNQPLESVMY
jgi:hypothetical protein